MVYGYSTNEEFIDKSYHLLEKLEAKGLWNKETLVIGLDKSVRPLWYTLKKISDVEGKEKPDVRFFNYTSHGKMKKRDADSLKLIGKKFKEDFHKYNDILIIDDHIWSGNSLKNAQKLLSYSGIFKKDTPYHKASLQLFSNSLLNDSEAEEFFTSDRVNPKNMNYSSKKQIIRDGKLNSGLKDKKIFLGIFNPKNQEIKESIPITDKETRQKFVQNRNQLSKDIRNYLHERHPEKISVKFRTLEKIASNAGGPVFIFSFLVGLFLSSDNLTGNVIGSSGSFHRLIGIILVLIGIGGFFIHRKLK